MRRVLITGSRLWTDRIKLSNAMNLEMLHPDAANGLTIVNGMAGEGADLMVHEWFMTYHLNPWVHEEEHHADWERACDASCYHRPRFKNGRPYCPMAGHLRNQEMVDTGADICLAFPVGTKASKRSRGTWDCMDRAKRAGIVVVNLGIDQESDDGQERLF